MREEENENVSENATRWSHPSSMLKGIAYEDYIDFIEGWDGIYTSKAETLLDNIICADWPFLKRALIKRGYSLSQRHFKSLIQDNTLLVVADAINLPNTTTEHISFLIKGLEEVIAPQEVNYFIDVQKLEESRKQKLGIQKLLKELAGHCETSSESLNHLYSLQEIFLSHQQESSFIPLSTDTYFVLAKNRNSSIELLERLEQRFRYREDSTEGDKHQSLRMLKYLTLNSAWIKRLCDLNNLPSMPTEWVVDLFYGDIKEETKNIWS